MPCLSGPFVGQLLVYDIVIWEYMDIVMWRTCPCALPYLSGSFVGQHLESVCNACHRHRPVNLALGPWGRESYSSSSNGMVTATATATMTTAG